MAHEQKYLDFFRTFAAEKERYLQVISRLKIKKNGSDYEQGLYLEQLVAEIETGRKKILELLSKDPIDTTYIDRIFKEVRRNYKNLYHQSKPVWQQWVEAIIVAGCAAFIIRTFVFGLYHVPTGSAEPNLLVGDRLYGNKLAYRFNDIKFGDLVIFDNPEFQYSRESAIQELWQKYIGVPFLFFQAGPDNWVKRVLALPGDTIEGRIENGVPVLYRNNQKLPDEYVNPYPLLLQNKQTGIIDPDAFGAGLLPGFLKKKYTQVRYTYDPSKSYENQEYYKTNEAEVVTDQFGEKILYHAFTPTHAYGGHNVDKFGPFVVPENKYWVQGDSRKNSRDSRWWGFLDRSLIQGRASFTLYSIDSEEPFWLFALLAHPIRFFTQLVRWNRCFKNLVKVPDLRELRTPEQVKLLAGTGAADESK